MVANWCYFGYICNQRIRLMAQTAFTVRMDADIKKRFDELCTDFGMSANTAFNVFARTVVKQERIPFEVETERELEIRKNVKEWKELVESIRSEYYANGGKELSLDEINEIIHEVRMERRAREENKGKEI